MQTDTSVIKLNTSLIIPNKYQPRKVFDEVSLNKLAESIKIYGIINPILVRKKDDKYEIIAGERRFRAAQKLGLTEVPVIIKNADEQQMAELALIENIQRQGLTPIEEAKSYEEIMRIGNQTQASLAQKIGKSQSSIANKIRLLSLPQEIQDALNNKMISERHARSLISIENKEQQLELLNRIITEKLTVKETEEIINSKDINEEEIKQAISDIMKSLNIKEEEKEDDNMNNGNFFPNFDNNNVANNNASLNTMNMQSMNQPPLASEPEVVMPTNNSMASSTLEVPTQQPMMPIFDQLGAQPVAPPIQEPQMSFPNDGNMNINQNSVPMFGIQQENMVAPTMVQPQLEVPTQQPMMPTFDQLGTQPVTPPMQEPQMSVPMVDEPLFNPNITMPVSSPSMPTPQMQTPLTPVEPIPEPSFGVPTTFDVPVTEPQPIETSPVVNKLSLLQEFLNSNGYEHKIYNNDTTDCIIIELPKN